MQTLPVRGISHDLLAARLNRRQFARRTVALGVSSSLVAGLLASCGDDSPDSTGAEGDAKTAVAPGSQATPAAQETPKAEGQATKKGGTLIIGMEAELSNIDPAAATGTSTLRPLSNMFDPLVNTFGDRSELQPSLAESWETAEDGLSVTVKLRSSVKFHDGTDLDAEAVVLSFDRMLNEESPYFFGPYTFPRFFFSSYKSSSAVDPMTVKFDLKQADATFLSQLAWLTGSIVSPTAVKAMGENFQNSPVGTGAFKFVSWEKNVKMTMERFDDHWRGAPNIDQLIWKPVVEEAQRFNQLASGEVDLITSLNPQFVPQIQGHADTQLIQTPSLHTWWVFFNLHEEHFKDKRVRQAFNHAINKDAIIKNILQGTAVPSHGWCWPDTWAYEPDVVEYPYDPEKAKQLLAEAGYPDGFDVEYYVPESGSGMIAPKEIATAMQADLKAVGVNAQITTEEWISYIATYRKGLDNIHGKQFGMAQRSWLNVVDDPGIYAGYISSGTIETSANLGYYENPEYDELIAEAKTTADQEKRAELYKQAQKIFAEDAPWIFMFHANYVIAGRKNVKGVVLNPNQNVLHLKDASKA